MTLCSVFTFVVTAGRDTSACDPSVGGATELPRLLVTSVGGAFVGGGGGGFCAVVAMAAVVAVVPVVVAAVVVVVVIWAGADLQGWMAPFFSGFGGSVQSEGVVGPEEK